MQRAIRRHTVRLVAVAMLALLTVACAAGVAEAIARALAEPCLTPVAAFAQAEPSAPDLPVAVASATTARFTPTLPGRSAEIWPSAEPAALAVESFRPRSPPAAQ